MYVELISEALDVWDADLDDDALLDYVRQCRAALPARGARLHRCWADELAAEIAYDRAIVCLAVRHGIDVTPTNFAHPGIERDRLEISLLRVGVVF